MTSYEETPYPRLSYYQTHPDTIAPVGMLLGLEPAPVAACRVLELGCASGGNLIPMAERLPGSHFVGLDLSARQVGEAKRAVASLGLSNVEFHCLDVRDPAAASLGEFDYVIAHGLYSWVPPAARDALLRVARRSLAPQGIAYVSYNTYPGWHMMRGLREMMLYHSRAAADPAMRAAKARELVGFLASAVSEEGQSGFGSLVHAYRAFLEGEAKRLGDYQDGALLHDELEETNDPVYFHQFADHAAGHGLTYLSEVELRWVMVSNLPPAVRQALAGMADSVVSLEQYMDFVRNRQFRQTLLCRDDFPLDRRLRVERVRSLNLASSAMPLGSEPGSVPDDVQRFGSPDGAQFATNHPLTKAVLAHLGAAWPRVLPYEQAVAAARAAWAGDLSGAAGDEDVLCANLVQAHVYSRALLELRAHAPEFTLDPGERPLVSPWVRYVAAQSAEGGPRVTNLRHERVELDRLAREVAIRLDGAHRRRELVDELITGPIATGELPLPREDARRALASRARLREYLAKEVETCLRFFARAALLVDGSA